MAKTDGSRGVDKSCESDRTDKPAAFTWAIGTHGVRASETRGVNVTGRGASSEVGGFCVGQVTTTTQPSESGGEGWRGGIGAPEQRRHGKTPARSGCSTPVSRGDESGGRHCLESASTVDTSAVAKWARRARSRRTEEFETVEPEEGKACVRRCVSRGQGRIGLGWEVRPKRQAQATSLLRGEVPSRLQSGDGGARRRRARRVRSGRRIRCA